MTRETIMKDATSVNRRINLQVGVACQLVSGLRSVESRAGQGFAPNL
jgi:hypothetical protein